MDHMHKDYQYSFLNLTVFTVIPVLSFYGNQSIATSISYFEHFLKLISFSVINDFSKQTNFTLNVLKGFVPFII